MNTRPLRLTLAVLSSLVAPFALAKSAAPSGAAPHRAEAARPPFVGVELVPVDAPTRDLFKLPAVGGLLVFGVAADSPAAGKLGQGDILLKLDDQTLVNREQVRALVRARKIGDTAEFRVIRGGRETAVSVTLAEAPESAPLGAAEGRGIDFRPGDLLRDMRERTRRALRDAGHPDSLLDEGDVVVLDGKPPRVESGPLAAASRVVVLPEGSVTIILRDGKKIVTVKDREGRTLADGELDDALRAKLPPWAKVEADRTPVEAGRPVAMGAPRIGRHGA